MYRVTIGGAQIKMNADGPLFVEPTITVRRMPSVMVYNLVVVPKMSRAIAPNFHVEPGTRIGRTRLTVIGVIALDHIRLSCRGVLGYCRVRKGLTGTDPDSWVDFRGI
jgi:hypothetical protein